MSAELLCLWGGICEYRQQRPGHSSRNSTSSSSREGPCKRQQARLTHNNFIISPNWSVAHSIKFVCGSATGIYTHGCGRGCAGDLRRRGEGSTRHHRGGGELAPPGEVTPHHTPPSPLHIHHPYICMHTHAYVHKLHIAPMAAT